MPEAFRAEFTGERVIPGRVEDNLFNEHLARYRFTARLVREAGLMGRFLDAGCGAGYGTAELAQAGAHVLGIDVSADAVAHARANYPRPGIEFAEASCTAIPAGQGEFQLITAFEVIEHLADWREFLGEVRRVLAPTGIFLVSTPNRLYYAESREKAGPNPFHVHEFTAEEFRGELGEFFPHVKMLLQNHVEGIAFSGAEAEGSAVEISEARDEPAAAHFFLALCSGQPLPPIARFVFIPETGNVLQTRERHIALLDGEILKKNQWIEAEKIARAAMIDKVTQLEAELEIHNQWAKQANAEADRRAQLVADLQAELRKSNDWAKLRDAEAVARGEAILQLQEELRKSNEWAQARDKEAVERGERVVELQEQLKRSDQWAQARDAEANERGARVEQLQEEVAKATEWARARDAEAEERGQRIVALQQELAGEQANNLAAQARLEEEIAREQASHLAAMRGMEAEQARMQAEYERLEHEMAASAAGYEAAIAQWRREKEASDRWAMETESRLSAERDAAREAFAGKQIELEIAQERGAALQADANQLKARVNELEKRMAMIAQSRWVRLGRVARVGPEIESN